MVGVLFSLIKNLIADYMLVEEIAVFLHGCYYTSDSLKARFSREGNQLMTQYCLEK